MVTIQKWGNSLAVRIPSDLAKHYGLTLGSQVELEGTNGGIFVRPVVNKPTLDGLLAQIKEKTNPHLECSWERAKGREFI
ncbi:antitoxin MazE [Alkalihalobacillus xiaoxiensis]|uniref:Antitoxin MazE n=1 Tax=Shouchella xiaoxiensis TaxID=766895 RepID=A0ABS2T030_9BACI|nr:AbrB/MazE/SpoVT family DNA-binding domain-containing protein [Shouchella xiaoxiensis]MBM7839847.1 antitoxin MazE [Shouchella xiaoxiensis]